MKKYIVLTVLMFGLCSSAFAQYYRGDEYTNPLLKHQQVTEEPEIIRLSREGDVEGLRRLLGREGAARRVAYEEGFYYPAMLQVDAHGNNALHVAPNERVFYFLYTMAHGKREELLSQKNKAGETPWMALVSYDRAYIFIKSFPSSGLRREMKEITKGLKSSGLNLMVAEIKRDALLKKCSVGGQNIWQRADALWRMAPAGSREKEDLFIVRNMIGNVAPFLIPNR